MYSNEFYKNLIKPAFTPSSLIFQIVWPILYILMAISFFIVLGSDNSLKPFAITLFIIQLILNFLWSPMFFFFGKMKLALLISFLMLICVGIMILFFFQISKIAGILQLPYFLWLIFATFLNASFIYLNSDI